MTDRAKSVPMMFRAQVKGRCQLHYVPSGHINQWTNEWIEASAIEPPTPGLQIEYREYQISWRFVTNAGQDEGIIRPVIDSMGMPLYPGSSMKGAFREACKLLENTLEFGDCSFYCGSADQPGVLRFHGGYTTNQDWANRLTDVAHPQQGWQVTAQDQAQKPSGESAFALISLYRPTIRFGISSLQPTQTNWDEVWKIWETALGLGIGCRVSSGYGVTTTNQNEPIITGTVLYQAKLQGTGIASQSLDKQPEFRPNMFRAAFRGHALRLFSGLNPEVADRVVNDLFGDVQANPATVGLLKIMFLPDTAAEELIDESGNYDVTGTLYWVLFKSLEFDPLDPKQTLPESLQVSQLEHLTTLARALVQFSMLLGGFGRSWRRAEHYRFYQKYYNSSNSRHSRQRKPPIGCHWEWAESQQQTIKLKEDAQQIIQDAVNAAQEWLDIRFPSYQSSSTRQTDSQLTEIEQRQRRRGIVLRSTKRKSEQQADCLPREAWRTDNVQVWVREAANENDSKIIPLLHDSKSKSSEKESTQKRNSSGTQLAALARGRRPNSAPPAPKIYQSDLTGTVGRGANKIGRIWHRMFSIGEGKYLEITTIFYQNCAEANALIQWFQQMPSEFSLLWPTK